MNANELAEILESDSKHISGRFTYSSRYIADIATILRQQQAEIEALKEVNTKQVDCISKQKEEYEKLWKEHMELFWKHEQDTDLTNE